MSFKPQGTLDSFVSSKQQPIQDPVFTSKEIYDRNSLFIGYVYPATTPQEARQRVDQMKRVVHSAKPATHEMAAWRCMALKPDRTGLSGPEDFALQSGSRDDGERWAGGKILGVMETLGIIDAVIIVSRWYGGELLGPARFTHIEDCATDVAKRFKDQVELADLRTLLESLDDLLSNLREEYQRLAAESAPSTSSPNPKAPKIPPSASRKPNYTSLDIQKARRLIRAREGSITSVKTLIAKLRDDANLRPGLPTDLPTTSMP